MEMKVLNRRCAGLDVHKAEVVACARVFAGRKVVQEVRRFGTTTRELMALGDWLEPARHARSDGGDRGLLEAGVARAG